MKRSLIYSLAVTVTALTAIPAAAKVIAPAPVYDRVARADVIVAGKVDSIEEKNVVLPDKSEMQIAVVKISDPILNAKGLTHIRVGFHPGDNPRFPHLKLTAGQEVCLFLTQKTGQTFYVAPMYFDVVDKKGGNYEKEVAEAQRCAKLLADADASLKSKDADERLLTLSMLLTRYGTPKEGQTKREAIDAGQSKLILQALADADWGKQQQYGQPSPQAAFARLGLTQKEGWTPPADFKEFPEAAKKWLKDNAEKHKIQKYVAEKQDK
jgi:hypothetical protein